MKTTGTVKWFNNSKGYGFILDDPEQDECFVHYRSILSGNPEDYKSLAEGDRVEFLKVSGDKGWQAAEVIKTASGSSQHAAHLTECPHCGKSLVDLNDIDEVDEEEEMV